MTRLREIARAKRKFLPESLNISDWNDLAIYSKELLDTEILDDESLKEWLLMRSEFDSILEEDKAWLYIKQSCNTSNDEYAKKFTEFVKNVEEKYAVFTNQVNEKLVDYCSKNAYPMEYEIFVRTLRQQVEIYREENVSIQSELEVEEQQYGAITGAMTIKYRGEEKTLQEAQNVLKSNKRKEREEVFNLIWKRRFVDAEKLNVLLSELLNKRQKLAENAGFANYLEFRFSQLARFDYTISDCESFHNSVAKAVVSEVSKIQLERKNALKLDDLYPYDLEVDVQQKPPLKPFNSVDELIQRSISCFSAIDEEFGRFLQIMKENAYLDLDSRKGKAPGGYNYPLHESNVPFIFMNATNNLRDMETMMHEGGHAIHSFLSKDLEFVYYKETPAEIAEVASMAMELISMEHWHYFFDSPDDLARAKKSQLEGVISVLPWVATVDKFQHWLYTNPNHTIEERTKAWNSIEQSFSGGVISWEGLEKLHDISWQKQIHIFQFPLYYIEYGIAQLGSIAIWKNYKENGVKAISDYRKALSLGYSKTLPELYRAAGVEFNFSEKYIRSLIEFVWKEYRKL